MYIYKSKFFIYMYIKKRGGTLGGTGKKCVMHSYNAYSHLAETKNLVFLFIKYMNYIINIPSLSYS